MENHQARDMKGGYKSLAVEMGIDFVIMYFVMYTMIATVAHLHLNINNLYMTLMMLSPMAVVMLVSMRSMFPSRQLNWIIIAGATLVFVASFVGMRTQAAVGNKELLRAMIPHHSGAILMCERASLTDPEVKALCAQIIPAQRDEIARMEIILKRY